MSPLQSVEPCVGNEYDSLSSQATSNLRQATGALQWSVAPAASGEER
jgi:hypothetical protein